jgi:1,4-dihydroxy-2-naphthoate octaprenyltransferase
MSRLSAVLAVARAPFLALPVALVAAGASAAAYDGSFDWRATGLALIGLLAMHVAVNALNEISDLHTGIDLRTRRTPFSGGSGTLPGGELTVRAAKGLAAGSAVTGAVIGVYFLATVGLQLLPILVLGALCVLLYTDVLTRLGVGEVSAGLGLGGLPVLGTALVQGGGLGLAAAAAAVPATLMTFDLLLLNEFPDEEADRHGGRRHLVIRLGRQRAASLYAVAALATPVWIVAAVLVEVFPPSALLGVLPSMALRRPLGWVFRSPAERVPVPALAANVQWNLSTGFLLAAGLAAGAWLGL